MEGKITRDLNICSRSPFTFDKFHFTYIIFRKREEKKNWVNIIIREYFIAEKLWDSFWVSVIYKGNISVLKASNCSDDSDNGDIWDISRNLDLF